AVPRWERRAARWSTGSRSTLRAGPRRLRGPAGGETSAKRAPSPHEPPACPVHHRCSSGERGAGGEAAADGAAGEGEPGEAGEGCCGGGRGGERAGRGGELAGEQREEGQVGGRGAEAGEG